MASYLLLTSAWFWTVLFLHSSALEESSYRGVTCFHNLGTLPDDRERLYNFVKGLTSELPASFINFGEIPSGPYDLFALRSLIWS